MLGQRRYVAAGDACLGMTRRAHNARFARAGFAHERGEARGAKMVATCEQARHALDHVEVFAASAAPELVHRSGDERIAGLAFETF